MNASVDDILIRQQAEFERIIADALFVGRSSIYKKLLSIGWEPEIAMDAKAFWKAFPTLENGDYSKNCFQFWRKHGFGTLYRWERLYTSLPEDKFYSSDAVDYALTEIKGLKLACKLLRHFSYVISEQENYV